MAAGSSGVTEESKDDDSRSLPLGSTSRNLPRAKTLPSEVKVAQHSEASVSKLGLERSKTERRKQSFRHTDPAMQLLDDKISAKKKLKMLKRIATVRDDGSVLVEVPSNVEHIPRDMEVEDVQCEVVDEAFFVHCDNQYIPPLQIVILIVGTRGDVQPFIAVGKRLQDYGHRVRLATHANFKDFVLTAGLEFYPLGGDPKVLAGYMVKNKGFLPSTPSEIPTQRKQIKEIIFSLLGACKDADVDSGIPFKADAIIANPPAYGHTHVAEALKVPIHIFFTMPWTATSEFPHPLSRVKQPAGYRLSYQIVDSMIWLGIRDMINDFRKRKLKLRPVTYLSGSQGSASDIPYGYRWSPHLVPKPKVPEPKEFVYLLDNVPHDWLFLQCKAVVHHGGAGTTAAGLKAACPTTVVPFFGDQPFWGEQVHARGVGPSPIPVDEFTLPKLVDAIKFMLNPEVKERAVELAKAMNSEDGVTGAVKAFLKHLPPRLLHAESMPAEPKLFNSWFGALRKCLGCA
ncbi:hypothetical protein HPP92_007062 [Vanilla planifolia]|uniref:sterol 3beta-glucosyltransferase n=1 Tax=Vanilla planifolia TaxID=51239 RepID=A0A835RFM4_VANPL|nr:hypothetical protein HPP92_007062 [Vanilla planifolia]